MKKNKTCLLLEDGTIFEGYSYQKDFTNWGEICFNTGMTGYQEIFTDPSYFGQIVVMSNVHLGNYGIQIDDLESNSIKVEAVVCRELSTYSSRSKSENDILEYFQNENKPILFGVDTREIVSQIREKGAMKAVISDSLNYEELFEKFKKTPSMQGLELASKVSKLDDEVNVQSNKKSKYKVAIIDMGAKRNMIRELENRGCTVKKFSYNIQMSDILDYAPDGILLSNGPGDPEPLHETVLLVKEIMKNNIPIFGICLGHQVLALANDITTYKMNNGHRGINHPVLNLETGKGEITSQNHGFAIKKEDIEKNKNIRITHVHMNDDTVAGIEVEGKPFFSVQYHPESNPGPHDSKYLFDKFIGNIIKNKK